jgi:hypothetical protein
MEYKNFNPADKITVDVPLFIRLLEYAREDAKTDMDLHKITENAVALSENGKTLTMDQYDSIVKDSDGEDKPSVINQLDRAKLQPSQNQMNENKNKHMKTQINEIKRMQQLAGLLKENQEIDLFDIIDSNKNELAKKFNLDIESSMVSGNDEGEPVQILDNNGNQVDFVKKIDWESNKEFYNNNKGIGEITLNGVDIIYIINPY